VDPAALQLDEEQDVQTGQADGFHGPEVTRDRSGGLGTQERHPALAATSGRRAKPVCAQDRADRCGRYGDAEFAAFPDDPQVSPAAVLPGQPQDELDDVLGQGTPAALE
jgi:hypothetical protein